MFTWLFSFFYYKLLKSGLLLDFYIKKISFIVLRLIILITNIFFSEKFIIEQLFFKTSKLNNTFFKAISWFSTLVSFKMLSLIFFVILILLLI